MKKTGLAVLCALLLIPALALAAFGKIDTVQSHILIAPCDEQQSPVGYWEIKNIDTVALELQTAQVDWKHKGGLFGKDELLGSDIYISMYPSMLKPGETGYLQSFRGSVLLDDASAIDTNELNIVWQTAYGDSMQLPVTAATTSQGEFLNGAYATTVIEVTVQNPTDDTLFDYYAVAGAYDAEGKLLFCANSARNDVGIPGGGQVTLRIIVEPEILEAIGGPEKIVKIQGLGYKAL